MRIAIFGQKLAKLIHLNFATMEFGFIAPKGHLQTLNWSDLLENYVETVKRAVSGFATFKF